MNARIKKLWVAALRSGKWRKAKGQLRKSTNYRCCLGVLCEVYMEDAGEGEWIEGTFQEFRFHLPSRVRAWAGFDTFTPLPKVKIGTYAELSQHNDGQGCKPKSQLEIADAIEEQL